jgi:Lhr-like helicase
MLATTSLWMGINISDVDGVVLWKFPIKKDLANYWQRLGRGGRGGGRTSKAYIFLPY